MLAFTNRLRPVAYIAIGALTLAWGPSADVQGCHGGGTGGRYSTSGTGGYGGQGGVQNYSSPQQTATSSTSASVNNPATVLAHRRDLKLTSKQVLSLKKMLISHQQQATRVLTKAQKRKLAEIVGLARKVASN